MVLRVTPTVFTPDVAPGPYVELDIQGINENVVPDPSVTDATTWGNIISGTYSGITQGDTTASFWSRNTSTFSTTPASLRLQTTASTASGYLYITPWNLAQPGQQVRIKVSVRVTATDSARIPSMRVFARDSSNNPLSVGALTWATTVAGSFTTQTNSFTLPANTYQFRVGLGVEGTPGAPVMTVFFDDMEVILQPGATLVSVSRIWNGEEVYLQGGLDQHIVGDTMVFYDYAVPFSGDVIYKAVTEDNNNTLKEYAQSSVVTLSLTNTLWLSDALSPEIAVKVTPDKLSMKKKTFSRPGGPVSILTRKLRPSVTGTRYEASSIPISFITYTILQRISLETLLQNVDPVMIRCSADHAGMPGLAFITFSDYDQVFIDAPEGDTVLHTISADFVTGPSIDIVVPLRTYDDYNNEFTSYGDTTYVSYLALLKG